jgi:hypothetical protein
MMVARPNKFALQHDRNPPESALLRRPPV